LERKLFDIFDCTAKTPINQGFSRMGFQSDHWFSSQPRYDHFDISAYMLNSDLEYNDYSIFHRTGRPIMSCCGARNFLLAVRFAKFRPLPLLFAPIIRHRRRSQTSPLRYLCIFYLVAQISFCRALRHDDFESSELPPAILVMALRYLSVLKLPQYYIIFILLFQVLI